MTASRQVDSSGGRAGFTVIELMIVTVVIAILALLVAGPLTKAREGAMDAASRVELRRAMDAVEMSTAVHGALPSSVTALTAHGFRPGKDVAWCMFQRVEPGDGSGSYVAMEVQHVGSPTRVRARYPGFTGFLTERVSGVCDAVGEDEAPVLDDHPHDWTPPGRRGDPPGRRKGQQ